MRVALLFALLLGTVTPTLAQTGSDSRLRTVVLGIAGRRGVEDRTLVAALSSVVIGVYGNDPTRLVIGPDDISRALEWEASKQQAGCDNSACLAEVGAALDAARIVTGTVDAVGEVFILSLTEIDARTLEPVARGQEEVTKNEAALLDATKRLATDVLRKSASLAGNTTGGAFAANAGGIEIASDPGGAQILVSNNVVGSTPTRIDNVAPGRHMVRLTRPDYETVEFEVPVHAGGTTQVKAELRLMRKIAEQNIEIRNARWRDEDQWNQIGGWTKVGIGVVGVGAGLGIMASGAGDGGLVGGLLVGAAGAGVIAWGAGGLLTPPPRPIPEWELERKVTVTPPKDKGDIEVKVLQEGRAPNATR